MRRISFWVLSTITTVVLLFGYHTSTMGASASAPPSAVSGLTPGQGTDVGADQAPAGRASRSSGTATQARTPGPSAPAPSAPAPTARTVTGPVVGTAYGPVQVALRVQGSTITGVDVLQHPAGNYQSDQINRYALPVLVRETLDRQGAGIDMVSGATYTSAGYAQSLQSALDQAGL